MLNITKTELWSVLNLLREIRDGSDPDDLEEDLLDMISMLEAIAANE